jgi:hypothetical protein
MATKLYLDTTNPSIPLETNIIPITISVIGHTILYTLFFNMASFIFTGRALNKKINQRLVPCLLIIMILGFIGRHYRAKDAFYTLGWGGRNFMNQGYVNWMFIS